MIGSGGRRWARVAVMALQHLRSVGIIPEQPSGGLDLDWLEAGRLMQMLARARTKEEILERSLDVLTECAKADAAAIWLYDAQGGRLEPAIDRGVPHSAPRESRPQWTDLFKLPLNSGGLLLGVLEAYSRQEDGFEDGQRAAMQMVGATLAGGLHRVALAEAVQTSREGAAERERLADLELVWSLTRATTHAVSYAKLFEALLTCLADVVEYDAAALLVTTARRPECSVALRRHGHEGLCDSLFARASAALAAFGGLETDRLATDLHIVAPHQPDDRAAELVAGFGVPLTQEGEVVGIIYVASTATDAFGESQVRVMHRFAEHASASMDRVRSLLAVEIERLETIIESLPQGILLLDDAGRVLMGNRTGQDQLRLMGTLEGAVRQLGPVPLDELVTEAIDSGIDLTRREIQMRLSGGTSHLAVTVVPVRERGETIGTVLSIENVTEIRQAEQRVFHDARLASIGELAAGLAHELNNPMMIILGLSEMLDDDPAVPEHAHSLLGDVREAALRAAEIVKQLMVYADTQADEGWDALSLPEVLEQAICLVASQCEREGVRVELDWAPDLPLVLGNAGKLQEAVLNLLRNAHEAVIQSGTGDRIAVRAAANGDRVLVEVADNGPGVPPALQAKIFDVFFTTKRDYQGKGLGLSTAHRIALEHSGDLEIVEGSEPGAVFRLTLPVYHYSAAQADA